jgi:hypothetical protein
MPGQTVLLKVMVKNVLIIRLEINKTSGDNVVTYLLVGAEFVI